MKLSDLSVVKCVTRQPSGGLLRGHGGSQIHRRAGGENPPAHGSRSGNVGSQYMTIRGSFWEHSLIIDDMLLPMSVTVQDSCRSWTDFVLHIPVLQAKLRKEAPRVPEPACASPNRWDVCKAAAMAAGSLESATQLGGAGQSSAPGHPASVQVSPLHAMQEQAEVWGGCQVM